ncbi:hypothetical protein V8C86DRAFT_3029655 [Haematococcus lacustris]
MTSCMGSEGTSRHKLARAKIRPLRAVLCSAPEMASAIPYISLALSCFTVGCQTCYLVPGSQNVSKLRQEIKEMRAELAELRSCAPALNVSGHSDNMPQISNASNAGLAMQRASTLCRVSVDNCGSGLTRMKSTTADLNSSHALLRLLTSAAGGGGGGRVHGGLGREEEHSWLHLATPVVLRHCLGIPPPPLTLIPLPPSLGVRLDQVVVAALGDGGGAHAGKMAEAGLMSARSDSQEVDELPIPPFSPTPLPLPSLAPFHASQVPKFK